MPWQFGAFHLTEDNGNRIIKYADALIDGVSPLLVHTLVDAELLHTARLLRMTVVTQRADLR